MQLKPIKIWYSVDNQGDLSWHLTSDLAEGHQDDDDEPWGESCTGSVETFEGADIHVKALIRSETTTMTMAPGVDVPVVSDGFGHDEICVSFDASIGVWRQNALEAGWDEITPMTWSWDGRVARVYG